MKNKELLEETVSIINNAIKNNTLEQGNCFTCFIGNLIMARMGYTLTNQFSRTWKEKNIPKYEFQYFTDEWIQVLPSNDIEINEDFSEEELENYARREFNSEKYIGKAKEELDSIGYSIEEIIELELAFEMHHLKGAAKCLQKIHETEEPILFNY